MKRNILLIYFIFILFLLGREINGSDLIDNSIKKGEIFKNGLIYKFEKTDFIITIRDNVNNIVFYNECKNENETIINFGYSETFDSFYVFKSKFNYSPVNYKFWFETEDTRILIKNRSSGAFYTPILIEIGNDVYVAYINENRAIVTYNLLQNKKKNEFKSKNSIMKLEIATKNNIKMIVFKELNGSQYKNVEIPVIDFLEEKFDFGNKMYRSFYYKTLNIKDKVIYKDNLMELQYNKFIAFGDSITYGTIDRESAPELGYIPRLLFLLQSQLYSNAYVVNEGSPGFITSEGLERIEDVIKNHKGKYLLFHYGTNDMAHTDIPLDSVKENITKMIEIALKYNIKPILTTLIPGNGDRNGRGRYGGDIYIYRSEYISDGIRDIAIAKNIPLLDFQKIFVNFPESDGGYLSLMSDELHPSEKGYQLMAEKWLHSLLDFPPINISKTISSSSGFKVLIQWIKSPELDISKYKIKYGFSASNINREIFTSLPAYTIIITPMYKFFFKKIYFKVNPVDTRDNESTYSPIFIIEINKKL